ncbi:MAG TPA: carbohydrate ABC transporter permease [Gaiellaceae bacterium]|nr:carbohydrate ABC transporter permease [Gaiellaceae bacterium]
MKRGPLQTALLVAAGLVLAVAILLPFLWALSASLQTESELFERPPHWVPQPATTENYKYVFTGDVPQAYEVRGLLRSPVTQEARTLPEGLRNSFIVAFFVVLINLVLGAMAAYTFARERFRGSQAAFVFILGSRLLPAVAVAIPIYMILRELGLLDTKLALVLVHSAFTLPFTIWVLTLYFQSLPREMEEAARVDGATRFAALRYVVLPLAAPGLAAVGAFAFLFSYSEFMFALLTTSTTNAKTVPVMISAISVNPDASYTLIAVGIILSVAAPMALALVFRRYITSGLVASLTRE